MSNSNLIEVFVFPLKDMVFYPNAAIPLNIFEPRYVQMIQDALEKKVPIALCLEVFNQEKKKNQPSSNRFIGHMTGIGMPFVLAKNEDKSMLVILQGVGKVEMGEVVSESPYIVCRAYRIEENKKVLSMNLFRMNRLKRTFQKWVKENVKDPLHRQALISHVTTPQQIIESLAMLLVKDSQTRQLILETNDINERLSFLSKILPPLQRPSQKKNTA